MYEVHQSIEITVLSTGVRLAGTIRHEDGRNLLVALDPKYSFHVYLGADLILSQAYKGCLYAMQTQATLCRENCFRAPKTVPRNVQRRRQTRVTCDLPAFYEEANVQEYAASEKDEEYMIEAHVVDISMGGARLATSETLEVGACLNLMVDLRMDDRLRVAAQVLRATDSKPTGWEGDIIHPYTFSLKFQQLSRVGQVQLQRFLQMYIPLK